MNLHPLKKESYFHLVLSFTFWSVCSPYSFISLFIHQFICSFIGHSVHQSVCSSISQSVHPLIFLFIHRSASWSIFSLSSHTCLFIHRTVCLTNKYVYSYKGLFIYTSISESPILSVHLSVYQSVCVFISQFFHSLICLLIHQFFCSFNSLSVDSLVFLFIQLSALYFCYPIKSVLRMISTPNKCGSMLLLLGKVVNNNIPQCTILCLLKNF